MEPGPGDRAAEREASLPRKRELANNQSCLGCLLREGQGPALESAELLRRAWLETGGGTVPVAFLHQNSMSVAIRNVRKKLPLYWQRREKQIEPKQMR